MKRLHAIVIGRVQGVYFRDFVRREAVALELTGWVRNTADGAVEVAAEGGENALGRLAKLLEIGPAYSRVEGVDVDYAEATGEFTEFVIRW